MRRLFPLAFFLVASTAASASALEQAVHRSLSQDACHAARLPWSFCERVGVAAYNVDDYEWSDLSAHAQIAQGQTRCEGANAAVEHMRQLGVDLNETLDSMRWAPSADTANHMADVLGRVLHEVQDNCAHHGMPNPQHAWWSLMDSCQGTSFSPDVDDDAIQCGHEETDEVIAIFMRALRESGLSASSLGDADEGWSHWPARSDVCAFLRSANDWQGNDVRWNNDLVGPALRDQLAYNLTVGDDSLGDLCSGDEHALDVPADLPVDTAGGQSLCWKVKLYCLGKADGPADEPPPWSTESAADDPASAPAPAAGCSIGHRGGGAGALLAVWLLLALMPRRRRRAR